MRLPPVQESEKAVQARDVPSRQEQERSENSAATVSQERQQENFPYGGNADEEDDGIVDAVVTDRMLQRVLVCAGIPVFVGFLLYPGFWYLKVSPTARATCMVTAALLHASTTGLHSS
jgi:hypothetical protein